MPPRIVLAPCERLQSFPRVRHSPHVSQGAIAERCHVQDSEAKSRIPLVFGVLLANHTVLPVYTDAVAFLFDVSCTHVCIDNESKQVVRVNTLDRR